MNSIIPELNSGYLQFCGNCKFYSPHEFGGNLKIFTMNHILFTVALYFVFIFLFFREMHLDRKRYLEADRLGDEHILREVERFLKEKCCNN